MMDSQKLWSERFQNFFQTFLRYMRLIGNSGLLFSFFFLVIFGSYYYSLLVKQIPEQFPVLVVIAIVMTFILMKANIRTFLKRADIVFLLPAEKKMTKYFGSALLYNIVLQMLGTMVIAIVFAPLYSIRTDDASYAYLHIIIVFMLIKGWNVVVYWHALKLNSERSILSDNVLRVSATFLFVYLLLIGAPIIYLLIIGTIMVVFLMYVSLTVSKQHGLKWERLIEQEEALATRFYKFVNAFVDVPAITERIKRRRWSRVMTSVLSFEKANVPLFLYTHAFFRAGQYFGIYTRLTLLGMLIIVFLPYDFGKIVGVVLFLYMTIVQLSPLQRYFSGHEMVTLYPIEAQLYIIAFRKLCIGLLVLQSAIFSLMLALSGFSLLYVFATFLSSAIICYVYVISTIKQVEEEVET